MKKTLNQFNCIYNKESTLKIGDVEIEFKYSNSNKKINDCMINILKQKIGKV